MLQVGTRNAKDIQGEEVTQMRDMEVCLSRWEVIP
jgi:hypothetical protein